MEHQEILMDAPDSPLLIRIPEALAYLNISASDRAAHCSSTIGMVSPDLIESAIS